MACKKVKDDKEKLKNDPYINDSRYIALHPDVRGAFQKYLTKNQNGSLTDFLARRKAIADGIVKKDSTIKGKRVIEITDSGSIQTVIMNDGEIS